MLAISRERPSRFWSALAIASIAALMLTTTASARNTIAHTVKAGGPDACFAFEDQPGCDGNYSFSAILYADGSVTGTYTDRFSGGNGIHGVIDCVSVEGNEAWVSGMITQGDFEGDDLAGLPFTTQVVDNGSSASAFDLISTSHTGDDTSCLEQADFELFETPEGNVVVR
jgi:hypothetical protein